MRLKLVVPKDKSELDKIPMHEYISHHEPQIKLQLTMEEYSWLLNNHVWDEMNEIASSMIDYGEEEEVSDIEKIKKIKEWLTIFQASVKRDGKYQELISSLINICNEAIKRETGIVFIL